MIDFTRNIKLTGRWRRIYLLVKTATYFLFTLAALFVLYRILFPSFYFDYFFNITQAKKSTLVTPVTEQGVPLKNDPLEKGGKFLFNTSLLGNFSDAIVTFTLKDSSALPAAGKIGIRKSYQAFAYPLVGTLGFAEGSLLTADGNFYLVSDGKLRKFSTWEDAQQLGFTKNMFQSVNQTDLAYTPAGESIPAGFYPNGTAIKVEDTYYQFKEGKLRPFVSEKAFLTSYDRTQALVKNPDFLTKYELSEDLLGFADGTLVSSPQSVFFLSGNKSYPFNNVLTFESMGFDWNDVSPASSDEIGIYAKQKVFDITQPHPDGTIFLDQDTNTYSLVKNGKRYVLGSEAIAKSYLKKNPVLLSSKDAGKELACAVQKPFWPLKTYACEIPVTELEKITGNNYQFNAALGDGVNLAELHVVLKKSFKLTSLKESLADIKQKLIQNYYGEQNQ